MYQIAKLQLDPIKAKLVSVEQDWEDIDFVQSLYFPDGRLVQTVAEALKEVPDFVFQNLDSSRLTRATSFASRTRKPDG